MSGLCTLTKKLSVKGYSCDRMMSDKEKITKQTRKQKNWFMRLFTTLAPYGFCSIQITKIGATN
jgi:hypothetical protein